MYLCEVPDTRVALRQKPVIDLPPIQLSCEDRLKFPGEECPLDICLLHNLMIPIIRESLAFQTDCDKATVSNVP